MVHVQLWFECAYKLCAPENTSYRWAPSPYHHLEYYLCPFGRVCSLLRRDPLPRALQAAANTQTCAPLDEQRGGPLAFSKTWLNSAQLHQGELRLALVSRGNHEGVINCCKKARVETHPKLFFFSLHLPVSSTVDFGKEPFYCFFNNTFSKCGIHCGEVDVVICATDECVTFVNGRERNMRLCQCLNREFWWIFYNSRG